MRLEFRQLEVFCEVVRLGSFSRAAHHVHLSQTSVSERIAALEEQVGARLLDRSRRRGVYPTPVGRMLYERALQLLADRERTEQEVRDMLGLRHGTLRLAASTVPGGYYLPRVIQRFRESYPDTHFTVSIAASEQVVDWVAAGTVEIGIAGDPGERMVGRMFGGGGERASLRAEATLWTDHLVLAVPARHPVARRSRITVGRMASLPFLMREPGSGTRRWIELYLQDALPAGASSLQVAAELGSLCAIKQAVIEGLGVSLLSPCTVEAEVRAGLIRTLDVEGFAFTRSFYLIRDQQRTLSPLCRLFVDELVGSTGAEVALGNAAT